MHHIHIDIKDTYLYHAVAWYIVDIADSSHSSASVLQPLGPHPHVLRLACTQGILTSRNISYECKESSHAYGTDGRPETWRRLTLSGADSACLMHFIHDALEAYKEHRASVRTDHEVTLHTWSDHDGWVTSGEFTKRPLSSLFLPGDTTEALLADLREFLLPSTRATYQALNIPMIKIVLLHGVPGSGKTSLVRCMASELDLHVASFAGGDMDAFSDAITHCPSKCILSVDDIDTIVQGKGQPTRDQAGFAKLLAALDGVTRKEPFIVFMTTNVPNGLDIALRRRVDHSVAFDYARKSEGVALIRHFFKNEEQPEELWGDVTKDGYRSITMCMLHKFLVRSMKFGSPRELLRSDPEAFEALYAGGKETRDAAHVYM